MLRRSRQRIYTASVSRRLAFHPVRRRSCCVAAVGAAQSQAQIPQPSFSSSVDIVSVDVNVVDHKGQPIRDLGREDFTLMVDGKMRKITSAQFISVEAAKARPRSRRSCPELQHERRAAGPHDCARRRSRQHHAGTVPRHLRRGRAIRPWSWIPPISSRSTRFPQDPPSISRPTIRPSKRRWDISTGRATFNAARWASGIAEALAFEKNNTIMMDQTIERVCGKRVRERGSEDRESENLVCTKMVKEESTIIASYAHERARNTINGLRAILERLGSSETPKTMMLVSEGIVVDNERRILEGFGRAAAAAHVTLYALKPEPSETDASQARMPALRSQDRATREEGLQYVTAVGGGELFRVLADPDFAFARVAVRAVGVLPAWLRARGWRSRRQVAPDFSQGPARQRDRPVAPRVRRGPDARENRQGRDHGSPRHARARDRDSAHADNLCLSGSGIAARAAARRHGHRPGRRADRPALDRAGAASTKKGRPARACSSPRFRQRSLRSAFSDISRRCWSIPVRTSFAWPCRTRAGGAAASSGRCGRTCGACRSSGSPSC